MPDLDSIYLKPDYYKLANVKKEPSGALGLDEGEVLAQDLFVRANLPYNLSECGTS